MATPNFDNYPPIERAIAEHSMAWKFQLYLWEVRNGLAATPNMKIISNPIPKRRASISHEKFTIPLKG